MDDIFLNIKNGLIKTYIIERTRVSYLLSLKLREPFILYNASCTFNIPYMILQTFKFYFKRIIYKLTIQFYK